MHLSDVLDRLLRRDVADEPAEMSEYGRARLFCGLALRLFLSLLLVAGWPPRQIGCFS
jgi:hypothetical protein